MNDEYRNWDDLKEELTKFSWRSWIRNPIANSKWRIENLLWKRIFKNHKHWWEYDLSSFGSVEHTYAEANCLFVTAYCKRCHARSDLINIYLEDEIHHAYILNDPPWKGEVKN